MEETKKRMLSGIKPTGKLTLGNYIGAIKQFITYQDEYEMYIFIADLHSLTLPIDPKELRENTKDLISVYLACGLDPEKVVLFKQSDVSEHAELGYVMTCNSNMGELSRMTQYKDKSSKLGSNESIPTGLYIYPTLMAADILLYDADYVPVGVDQKQHVELTRDLAERFNKLYGDTFKVPEPYIPKAGARIMGLQDPTSKMSKSSTIPNDTILLVDTPEEIMKKVKKAVTDSDGVVKYDVANKPGVSNLMTIYSIINNISLDEVEKEFEGKGYGDFKTAVADAIIKELEPFHNKYNELMNNRAYLEKIYTEGSKKASEKANKTLRLVYEKIGLI